MSEERPIADAATVILLREGVRGLETFLVKRSGKSGFMAGAHVFPGGRVDPQDRDTSLPHAGREPRLLPGLLAEPELRVEDGFALFVAGVRETLEESGLFLGETEDAARLAAAARAGAPFKDVLTSERAVIALHRLLPYARWITPPIEKKRFDTRFFFCRCDTEESERACFDGVETTAGEWIEPSRALALEHDRVMFLAPPTLRTLQELSQTKSVDEAIALGARRPLPLIRPSVAREGESILLTLPGDPLHPEKTRALPGPTRLRWDDGRWITEG